MSLILEALKKVERERTSPEQRGFLVLGPAAWAPSRSNAGWIAGMIAAAGIAGGAVYWMTRLEPGAGPGGPKPDSGVVPSLPSAPLAEPAVAPANTDWGSPPQSNAPRTRPAAPAGAGTMRGPSPSAPVLQLHAISEQDGVPIAVVNERVVRAGDTFDGVRVLRIGAAEVEVEVAGARRILRF